MCRFRRPLSPRSVSYTHLDVYKRQQHGWRIALEKAEKGVSGSKISATKRDAIQELKAEAEKGNIDILLVFMFDRLGRIASETPYVVEWFVKHGVEVWSTREGQMCIRDRKMSQMYWEKELWL